MKLETIAVVASICWSAVGCRTRTGHELNPDTARFVLGIDQDLSLTLDRRPVTREELTREWPRLASQVREQAKAAGKKLDKDAHQENADYHLHHVHFLLGLVTLATASSPRQPDVRPGKPDLPGASILAGSLRSERLGSQLIRRSWSCTTSRIANLGSKSGT